MMTPDDVRGGPGGLNDWANNSWLNPLAGVRIHVVGRDDLFAITDAQGRFTLTDTPAGVVRLAIDGRTATNSPDGIFFPEMVMELAIDPGVRNTVMGSMGPRDAQLFNDDNPAVYLPRLDEAMLTPLSATEPTVITATGAQNTGLTADQLSRVQLKVAPGSLVDEDGNVVLNPTVGLGSVPPSMVMDMLPPGVLQHSFDITIQTPGGAVFTTPAELTLPNIFGGAPGEKFSVMSFDHTTGRLIINGTATVSADGLTVVTDPDSGIIAPGWHGLGPPGTQGKGGIAGPCGDFTKDDGVSLKDVYDAAGTVNGTVGMLAFGSDLVGGPGLPKGIGRIMAADTLVRDYNSYADSVNNALAAPDVGGKILYSLEAFKNFTKLSFDGMATFAPTTPWGKAAGWLSGVIGIAEVVGDVAAGNDPFAGVDGLAEKVYAGQGASSPMPGWTPPPIPDRTETTFQTYQNTSSLAKSVLNSQSQIWYAFADKLREFEPWSERIKPTEPDAGLTPEELEDLLALLNELGDIFKDLLDNSIGDAINDVIDAATDFADAVAEQNFEDLRTAMDGPDEVVVVEEAVAFGDTLCAVLVNLDTGVEQRFKFNALAGIDQFLAVNTNYLLTVYDPVSQHIGSVTFVSANGGQQTNIPTVSMVADTYPTAANGLSEDASFVLGVDPDQASNLVPGMTDAEALRSGVADSPSQANVTGVIGRVDLLGDAKTIVVEATGDNAGRLTAYVATGSQGLAIVDVTNPRMMTTLAQLDLAGDATDVAVDRQTRLTAVATSTGIVVVDAVTPTTPRVLHTFANAGADVEVLNGVLYAAKDGVLTAYDMATRDTIGSASFPGAGAVRGFAAEGDLLYVIRDNGSSSRTLAIIEVDGGQMTLVGQVALPYQTPGDGGASISGKMTVSAGIVYVSASPANESGSGGFFTIDARDPSAPVLLSGVDNVSIPGAAIALNGSGEAVTIQQQGFFGIGVFDDLAVVDVSDPSNTGRSSPTST